MIRRPTNRIIPSPHVSPILTAARWMLLITLLVAPWPYACIPVWTSTWFTGTLFAIFFTAVVGWVHRRKLPSWPPVLLICLTYLSIHGWLLIANSQYIYDWEHFRFLEASPFVRGAWFPGAVDTVFAFPIMVRWSALFAATLVAADAAASRRWRLRLHLAFLGSGLLVICYGVTQRILHIPLGLWDENALDHNLFGPFYYHGNAGAFVNLMVPGFIGMVFLTLKLPNAYAVRAGAVVVIMITLAACVAIASKAAMAITFLLTAFSIWWFVRGLRAKGSAARRIPSRSAIAIAALAAISIPLLGYQRAAERWGSFPVLLSPDNPRVLAWRACLDIIPDAGLWGVGPGNFFIVFPHYTEQLGNRIMGIWEYAHNDYLQIEIEWGAVGFAVWAVIVAGALWSARRTWTRNDTLTQEAIVYSSSTLALVGFLLHSLVDFPAQIPCIELFVAVILGLLWVSPRLPDEQHGLHRKVLPQRRA